MFSQIVEQCSYCQIVRAVIKGREIVAVLVLNGGFRLVYQSAERYTQSDITLRIEGEAVNQPLAFHVELNEPYEVALERVTLALKEEGFGILTHIDVRATFKEKLNADFRPYKILGACNPSLSHKALMSEPQTGLMLPCNVTVEAAENGGSRVSIVNPEAMLSIDVLADNDVVCGVAAEARTRLERVAAALSK